VALGQKVARERKSCGARKGPDFKASISLFKWPAGCLNRRHMQLCPVDQSGTFGPAVLHGCTPLSYTMENNASISCMDRDFVVMMDEIT